jgi:hypothetical protein
VSFDETNFPELPPSWTSVSVDQAYELVTVKDKIQTKSYLESGGLAVVDQGSALVGGYTNATSAAIQTNLPVIVFGDHTRAIKYIDFPFAAGADGIKVLRPAPCLLSRLFFHFLKAIRLPDKGYARHFQHLRTARIAVPPLPEQKRIADKLDALLARVVACRERLDRVPAILKRFRQAVLAAATSGKLTEEWRAEQIAQMSPQVEWTYSTAGDLCEWITKGTTPPKDRMYDDDGDIPYIKVYNLCFNGKLDFSVNPTFIDKETHAGALKRSKVLPGDVVMNIVGPPLGKVSIIPDTHLEWNINQAIALFRPKDRICNQFLAYFLMCEKTISEFVRKSKATAGQFNLTLEICREVIVPVPSMMEQHEIVRRVETLFAYADRLEVRYTTARAHVERLTPTLLAKAFRGELVPQDPNDEPASVLLERIRANGDGGNVGRNKRSVSGIQARRERPAVPSTKLRTGLSRPTSRKRAS